jgi:hypothetical protein
VALDDPAVVVGVLEGVQGQAQVLDGGEAADPEQVFLERADEALDAAVALGLAHEGGRARDAEEGDLPLVVVGDELAAVIVAQLQAARDPLGERAEAGTDTLAERLERLDSGAWLPGATTGGPRSGARVGQRGCPGIRSRRGPP